MDAAVGAARAELLATGDPRLAAVAWSFQLFAGAAAGEPLRHNDHPMG